MIPQALAQLLEENKWEEALAFLNNCQEPLNDELLEKQAWCYSRIGKYNNAILIYQELLSKNGDNAKWQYSLGYQYYAQKDYLSSVKYFEKALEIYPSYFKVKYRLAYAYLQIAGSEKPWSKDVYWKAINQLREAHQIYNQFNEEEQSINRSVYADICALHGKTMINTPKYIASAIELLRKSIELKYDEDVQYQLAKAYYLKKEYDRALQELPRGDKSYYYVQELKSQILAEMGRVEESNQVLFNLLKFRKKDYIYQRIAINYLDLQRPDEALKFATSALRLNQNNYKNHLICGQVYMALHQYKTALEYLEKSRLIKQKIFHVDSPEAVLLIDKIIEETENKPINCADINTDINEKTHHGKIIKYNSKRGFGFIQDENSNTNYFFHITQCDVGLIPKQGVDVEFIVIETKNGLQAQNVTLRI